MSGAVYKIGDVFDRMAELPDGSVDLVLTSPPFLALRSYLPADHPDKAKEIGSEPTPAAFIDTLLRLTAEWRRILAPHGSIAVELGDTYSGSGGAGGDYSAGGLRDGQERFDGSSSRAYGTGAAARPPRRRGDGGQYGYYPQGGTKHNHDERPVTGGSGWPLAKSLCLIPELYRIGLVYGVNALTGEPSPAGQFRARNVVRWCRPNPPVGALGDKFRPATSEMVVACVSDRRYFDLDAVRTEHVVDPSTRPGANGKSPKRVDGAGDSGSWKTKGHHAGAPPLDWWEIPTAPYAGSHYATWPPALCKRPIEAMVPRRVCTVCGKPSERIVRLDGYTDHNGVLHAAGEKWQSGVAEGKGAHANKPGSRTTTTTTTTGWTDCGHDAWRNGVVLDPFAGSGTTLAVATGCGRDAIGIDLDARNADLARERVGMFLEVEEPRAPLGAVS